MLVGLMLRGWLGLAVVVAAGIALFAGAVLHALHRPPPPRGYSGIEFARFEVGWAWQLSLPPVLRCSPVRCCMPCIVRLRHAAIAASNLRP